MKRVYIHFPDPEDETKMEQDNTRVVRYRTPLNLNNSNLLSFNKKPFFRENCKKAQEISKINQDFFINDFQNRFQKQHPEYNYENFNDYYFGVPIDIVNSTPKGNRFFCTGSYNPRNNLISIAKGKEKEMLSRHSHEMSHYFYDVILTNPQIENPFEVNTIIKAYNLINADTVEKTIREGYATNTQIRKAISSKYGNILNEELDKKIEELTEEELIEIIDSINSSYINSTKFSKDPNTRKQELINIRKALQDVARETSPIPRKLKHA